MKNKQCLNYNNTNFKLLCKKKKASEAIFTLAKCSADSTKTFLINCELDFIKLGCAF